jgi:hypothetical protein
MEIATKRVESQRCGELQPGWLRVHSDGERIYAEDFKAELVRQRLVLGTSVAAIGYGPPNQREPAAPLDRAATCLRRPNGCATGAVIGNRGGIVASVFPGAFSIAHICSAVVYRDQVSCCTHSPSWPS